MASKVSWKIQLDQRMKRLNGARNVLKIQLDQHKKQMDALYGETPSDELRSGYCKSIFFISVSCKLLSVSTHSAFISTLDN